MDQPFFFFFFLILVPLDVPDFRRRTTTLAIVDTSSVVALDVVGVTGPLAAVNNNGIKLAPLVDVVDVGSRQGDHQDADHNQQDLDYLFAEARSFFQVLVHLGSQRLGFDVVFIHANHVLSGSV